MNSKSRRLVLGGLAASAVFAAVIASAATLGGITAESLGADNTVVSSCDTDGVALAFDDTDYTAPGPNYGTTDISVTGIDAACNTKSIKVTLQDTAGASLAEYTGSVAAGAFTGTGTTAIDDEAVVRAAVVIFG